MASPEKKVARLDGGQTSAAPSVSLPKGGGAIRGMGEKFAANPITGTGSLTVPIAASPGRASFGPQLALTYDSGAGNGPFGFGWNLSLPGITRKTDKGLPRYQDAEESDVFILSGAEDLVPALDADGTRWSEARRIAGIEYRVHRYRPRIEGLFARIERWTNTTDATDVFWRSLSRDNILTLYGQDENSRIADPEDAGRIFSWLICETRDDTGNAVIYQYQAEDGTGVDLARAHERNRGDRDNSQRTANRYLKRIRYGNRTPLLDNAGHRPLALPTVQRDNAGWMFEVVFDYGEHAAADPKPNDTGEWRCRHDPFSTYRAGFEVRTYRLCRRVLMFHHFPEEVGVGQDCLVRSTNFTFRETPIAAFIAAVTQNGYKRVEAGGYLVQSLPPLEFEYSAAAIGQEIHDVDPASLENLPYGVDGAAYQWVDLDGEGLSGILTEQGSGWFYKRNESAITRDTTTEAYSARFAPVEHIAGKPAGNPLTEGRLQFLDLAGDGQVDLVELDRPVAGFYERTDAQDWELFRPFSTIPNLAWNDPNLKFIDLTGDGHADVLITQDQALTWYPSLAEDGFGAATKVNVPTDEERGPRVVFADGTQTIFLADLSGDGLTDIARIRNGEVCYWPNLGYGRFGVKVTMDDAPWFDAPNQFDPRRIRLADIDGSGVTDILYLGRHQTRFWFNQSGNAWSPGHELPGFPAVDSMASVAAVDLLGNGTACLVWSSPLPGASRAPMKYLNLMAEGKPHLMVRTRNNLGAETQVRYTPSTYFYLRDQYDGKPWITKLPFPVHVVERVETYDHISRNRFVTRYAYHHGYFDGVEREFRGFGMVEQTDTEEFGALTADGRPPAANEDAASHVPPVVTRSWFHTGVYLGRERVSNFFTGLADEADRGEYYREPSHGDEQAKLLLLDDTILAPGLTPDEERQAARSLKGMMLRQEVYALDGVGVKPGYPFGQPYTVTEQNFTVRLVQHAQPLGSEDLEPPPQEVEGHTKASHHHHAVVFSHPRETLIFHYERGPDDPRVQHALTLAVDDFGNVLKAATVSYGRRRNAPEPEFTDEDRVKQRLIHITVTEETYTNAVDDADGNYRTPLPAESATYELRKPQQERSADGLTELYRFEEVLARIEQAGDGSHDIAYEDIDFEAAIQAGEPEKDKTFRRLIERGRTLYRRDDLTGLGDPRELEPLALPGDSYTLALTPELLRKVFKRKREGQPDEELLPPSTELDQLMQGRGADAGGYVAMDGAWWIPSGQIFYSADEVDAATELAEARAHFFLPRRFVDPFDHVAKAYYDATLAGNAPGNASGYDLLLTRTEDAVGNVAHAENDYRVLGPRLLADPNGNRVAVAYDALGLVTGTAVMGKRAPGPIEGDSLEGFDAELDQALIDAFFAAPRQRHPNGRESEATEIVHELLAGASSRILYDVDRFRRTQLAHPDEPDKWLPACAATIARETHVSELEPGTRSKLQVSFSYSDGFDREIQSKTQAEPGPTPQRGADGQIILGADGEPVMTATETNPRWLSSGWTIFNNKGAPVRQYEPFFSDTHHFELGVEVGVSPVLFYDPVERVIVTLHPDHTWEKVVFDPWQETTYDVNDTVAFDPRSDPDVADFFARLPDEEYLPTWREQRIALPQGDPEHASAEKAIAHADTPTVAHFDALGRPFLTLAANRYERKNGNNVETVEEKHAARVDLDIEGNQRQVIDAHDRVVLRYDYNMLGDVIHHASMEAGERWMLNDVSGNAIRAFDSRGHAMRDEYDALRRPLNSFVRLGAAPEIQVGRTIYGDSLPDPEARNLRGQVVQVFDQAGVATSEAFDFKDNLVSTRRQLAREYKKLLDWSADVPLEEETFSGRMRYDALEHVIQVIAPHSDRPGAKVSIIQPRHNEANLLEQVAVWLNQDAEPVDLLDPSTATMPAVRDLDYDAKGQRTRIEYGNGVLTTYEYDPLTLRLRRLRTRRGGESLQDLQYTYDPTGNITHIRDDAQRTIFFDNQVVAPSSEYRFDAVYQMIEATGREHLGQAGARATPPDAFNRFHTGLPHPGVAAAMGRYTERYEYDFVGNFKAMKHFNSNPALPSWTRAYQYDEESLLEAGKVSNRLSRTTLGRPEEQPITEAYTYDAHGNMISMPHLPLLVWGDRDLLQATSRQVRNTGTPEMTYYVYAASGQRSRKVTERQAAAGETPTIKEERLYLSGFELFRQYSGNGGTVTLERETLHLMDDEQRIALVETKTVDAQTPSVTLQPLVRFQLGNHLDSASLELDGEGQIISYEEYFPYGSTSYQAVRSDIEVPPKRYRYTGMERDEESGLNHHGARYYAPWLARWTSCDPTPLADGPNMYAYAANPTALVDPSGHGPEEQRLGARHEKASKKHQDEANKRRQQTGRKKIHVDYQKGADKKRKTIPDEVKRKPRDLGKKKPSKTVVEQKARHVNSKRNKNAADRKADIRESLDQNKKQLKALEKSGKIGPDAKGKVVRTIYDSNRGKTADKVRAAWKAEANAERKAWVNEAKNPTEKALRERVNVVTTTRKSYSRATKNLEAKNKANSGGGGGRGGGGRMGGIGGMGGLGKMDLLDPSMMPEQFREREDPRDFNFPAWVHVIPRVGMVAKGLEFGMWAMKHRGPYLPTPYAGYLEESAAQGRNPVCRLCHDPDVRASFGRSNQASSLNQFEDVWQPDDTTPDDATRTAIP